MRGFPVAKKEQLIPFDGTANSSAKLVQYILGLAERAHLGEVILRAKGLVRMEFVGAAMKFICAGLGDDVDRCPANGALLGVVRICDDVHAFDGVRRGYVGNVGGQPSVGIRGTVYASGVALG